MSKKHEHKIFNKIHSEVLCEVTSICLIIFLKLVYTLALFCDTIGPKLDLRIGPKNTETIRI